MADSIRIAGVCGSLRKGSYNAMALEAAKAAAPSGVELDIIRLNDVELYNGDVEKEGWPPGVQALRDRVERAHAVLLASPEYNYGVPGVLKNAMDWLSRPTGEGPIAGKPMAVMGASTSRTGTARAQADWRNVAFYNSMPLLTSVEVLLFQADKMFDEDGMLVDEKAQQKITQLMEDFADWIRLTGKS
jgi:chromate reductase, NAD(P)H dehydrogenase (quinone)